jgi:hypothetical protein
VRFSLTLIFFVGLCSKALKRTRKAFGPPDIALMHLEENDMIRRQFLKGTAACDCRLAYAPASRATKGLTKAKGKRVFPTAWLRFLVVAVMLTGTSIARGSDHLDTPTVIADPAADIGDIFAWTSSDGRQLNLVMTIVGHQFSDKLQYVFHVDSGARFGVTTATTTIICQFDTANAAECWAGDADHVRGDASKPVGLQGEKHRFRLFAGLRDDPFFNNVKGTRAALTTALAALKRGAAVDAAGCPAFDEATSREILNQWRHTDGGPARKFLAGWKSAALVISVDLDVVNRGGNLLAVWATVHKSSAQNSQRKQQAPPKIGEQIERVGRPLTKNALLSLLDPDDVSDQLKERYNRAAQTDWPQFTEEIEKGLALYDGFDGRCRNQWFVDRAAGAARPYHALAKMLADDRLWIDSRSAVCTHFLAVELAATHNFEEVLVSGPPDGDCGGRTPNYDAVDALRSFWAGGISDGVNDGLDHDDHVHSTTEFPFLAAP